VLVGPASGSLGGDAESAVAATEARWRGRAQEVEAVREDEKRRVARELHDRLGADLSLLRVELARLVPKLTWGRAEVRKTIERLRDHAGELLETVRRISRELRPRVLDHVAEVGLASVLEHVTAEVHRRAGFVVHLDARLSEQDDAAIDPARAEAAYHVVREALNNVVRHSGATRAVVAARVERAADAGPASPAALVVEVLDDGRGATAAPMEAGSAGPEGIGWWSLSERVRVFGGDVSVRAEPGVGTTVRARIPLEGGGRP
jgi:signal transduction histidine kinase